MVSLIKDYIKRTFTGKRIITSLGFSAVVGVSYWATTVYEAAFSAESSSVQAILAIIAFFLVALVLLLFGGRLLDYIADGK